LKEELPLDQAKRRYQSMTYGAGKYSYELVDGWAKCPEGWPFLFPIGKSLTILPPFLAKQVFYRFYGSFFLRNNA